MKTYYYLNGRNEQQGPVPGESLPNYGVKSDTLVWTAGMAQWTPAGKVEELAGIIPPPPPIDHPEPSGPTAGELPPDNHLVWAILCTVLCCLPLSIAAIVYSARVETLWNQGKHAEARKAASTAETLCYVSLALFTLMFIIGFFIAMIGEY